MRGGAERQLSAAPPRAAPRPARAALLALFAAGCAGGTYVHSGSPDAQRDGGAPPGPAHTVMILFTAGADHNDRAAPCPEGGGVPRVLRALAGSVVAGKTIVVHGYCPTSVGNLGGGISMAEARAPELESLVGRTMATGVPARQIFVAGHSMGGWAAVLVGARRQVQIGGVISFAPANGIWLRDLRGPSQWAAYARQRTAVDGVRRLNALLYVFAGDPYNAPEDLAFLKSIDGVRYVTLDPATVDGGSCSGNPHRFASTRCFAGEGERIRRFVAERLASAE